MDTVGEEEGGMIWESNMETPTLPYVKWTASESLPYDAGNPKLVSCDNLKGWGAEKNGGRAQERGDICIPMADSCGCMAEASTIYCKVIIL